MYISSNVPKGSGVSSSAAFEVLIGVILNDCFMTDKVSPIEIAQIGQWAENVYFGKPCGLMDQMASSVGNIITIDFADPAHPDVEPVAVDFSKAGLALCILDSCADHADLTDEYAAVPAECRAVAAVCGGGSAAGCAVLRLSLQSFRSVASSAATVPCCALSISMPITTAWQNR